MDEFEAYENMLAYFNSKEEYRDLYIAYQEPYIRAISYSYYMCINSDLPKKDIKYYLWTKIYGILKELMN